MKKVGTGFLATTNGRRPTVRPMSAYLWVGGDLWLATGAKSVKVADARLRPAIEFCVMDKDFAHVRIAGRCILSNRPADKKRMFAAYDWMKLFFESAESPGWSVMKIRPTSIRLMGSDMQYREVL